MHASERKMDGASRCHVCPPYLNQLDPRSLKSPSHLYIIHCSIIIMISRLIKNTEELNHLVVTRATLKKVSS